MTKPRDVAVIIVNRNRPGLTDSLVDQIFNMKGKYSVDIYVVEMGSDNDKYSEHRSIRCSIRYNDPDFKGKCYGHNVGLRIARSKYKYKYYWILMNDLVFNDNKALRKMLRIMHHNPKIGILSPTELKGSYAASIPQPHSKYHLVSTCDYLSLLIRSNIIEEVGFLNPAFKYSWGAIHELAYKTYKAGYIIAYCDTVIMKHLGGTTYGKAKNTISRKEYITRAKKFAATYFVENYGEEWNKEFSKVLPAGTIDMFATHRKFWENEQDSTDKD
jgi:GT2 family glycosyltransferase